MKELYIKQKVMSLRGRFSVLDAQGQDIYTIEGSFLQFPKTFTVRNQQQKEIATISKKVISLLPTFYVEMNGEQIATIRKEFTLFKSRYSIDVDNVTVEGNWWDLNFNILNDGQVIATIEKQLLTWGDTYRIQILDERLEPLIISIVIAIDCAKADNAAAGASINF